MRLQSFLYSVSMLVGTVLVHGSSHYRSSDPRTRHTVFHSQIQNDTSLRYVANSGICETTPGVNQYSGYIDVGPSMSMWFWFFEARNAPETAPFALWLNGGPGCSSMTGLFQENGPCLVNSDGTSTYLNPYSWNNVSNIIYIDQPIGTGFSYGTDTVNSTESAATFVWKAFQILFESQLFSEYSNREFIFATESYGGHYGPSFVTYFEEQNSLIASGAIQGEPIVVSALMINNGWYDPLIHYIAYYTFADDAPGYGQLQPEPVLTDVYHALYDPNKCIAQERECYAAGSSAESDEICANASTYCATMVRSPAIGDRDPYDLRQNSSALFPPSYYLKFLSTPEVVNAIGANATYQECSDAPYELFAKTGDDARTWLPQLSKLVDSKMKVLVWAGDADIDCNWLGGYAVVLAMDWYGNETLHNTPLSNITLGGRPIAAIANVDNFSFARIFDAGHEVPAFQPEAVLEIFTQVVRKEPLHST